MPTPLSSDEPTSIPRPRRFTWYVKFFMACYGAGLGSAIVLLLVSMPFGGLSWMTDRHRGVDPLGVAIFLLGSAFGPFIWRRLR